MKPTPSTRAAFKKLVDQIHPQLPLDARESRRLVNVLNDTFKKQLDKHHPPQSSAEPAHRPLPMRGGPINPVHSQSPVPRSSHVSTSDHLESILTNPLFAHVVGSRRNAQSKPNDEPHTAVAAFKDLVARGAADLKAAAKCLRLVLFAVQPTKNPKAKETIAQSHAGSEVLAWLYSSGTFDSLDFKVYRSLGRMLTTCLIAEERLDVLEAWFFLELRPPAIAGSLMHSADIYWRGRLTEDIVRAKHFFRDSPDSIFSAFSRCINSHRDYMFQPDTPTGEPKKLLQLSRQIFSTTGHWLTGLVSRPHNALSISPATHDKFISDLPHWSVSDRIAALLHLYHPVRPDATASLSYLRSIATMGDAHMSPLDRQRHVQLCLDTANLLLLQENTRDGAWVINHARGVISSDERKMPDKELSRFLSTHPVDTKFLKLEEEYIAAKATSLG